MNIKNLKELGDIVSNELINNKNLKDLSDILNQYDGNDWLDFIRITETYNKHSVYKNDLIEIYIITWSFNQSSPIHNHPQNGCLLRLLSGNLCEEIYDSDLNFKTRNRLAKNDISYMEGNKIVHRIMNYDQISVSVHIYCGLYNIKYFC